MHIKRYSISPNRSARHNRYKRPTNHQTGIEAEIREAYTFICHNHLYEKDEIILVGFSRGSFTVRALAYLINDVGVLRKQGLRYMGELFEHWANQPVRPNKSASDAQSDRAFYNSIAGRHLKFDVKIKACACWDTVAALPKDKLRFVTEEMPDCLERAIQAVALNEERGILTPMLWKVSPKDSSEEVLDDKLRQCWFLGSHTDIYGEGDDGSLANISLAWILCQLKDIVAFDEETTVDIAQSNTQLAHSEAMSKAKRGDMHEVYELKIKLPVEEYQPTTDIQFNKAEKSERVASWSIRKPFTSGPLTNEKVHWSVPDLLDKKLVRRCKPLEKLDHKYRTSDCSDFERSLIESWASKDCLAVILDIMRTEQKQSNGAVEAKRSRSANFVPTYAVLLKPENFEVARSRVCKSTLEVHPKHQAGPDEDECRAAGEPVTRSSDPSFKLSRIFKTEDDWVLSGSIEVPTVSALVGGSA